jgi:hypothetical protein
MRHCNNTDTAETFFTIRIFSLSVIVSVVGECQLGQNVILKSHQEQIVIKPTEGLIDGTLDRPGCFTDLHRIVSFERPTSSCEHVPATSIFWTIIMASGHKTLSRAITVYIYPN